MKKGALTGYLSVFGVFVCLGSAAYSEVILLRDGSKISGDLLKRTTTELHLKVDGLDLVVAKKDVKAIDGKDLATDYVGMYQERVAALEPGDAESRYTLALWCDKHGLKEQAKKLLTEVTELAPWHEQANLKLGKIRHDGLWWTKEELEAKGLVLFQGEWITKEEHDKVKDQVRYMNQWVSKKDKEMLEERKYSPWKSKYRTTHRMEDLRAEIRVIQFINRLDLTKKQMRELVKVLARAEAERQGFLDKRHEIMAECEVAWLRLKEAAMHGVIDSFNVSGSIEGPAGMAEKAWLALGKAYTHRMTIHKEALMKALATKQRHEIMYGLCGDCHCAHKTSVWEEPPDSIKNSDKYCMRAGCHAGGKGMGSDSGDEDEHADKSAVDPEALAIVEEIRAARPDQLDAIAKRILELYPERGEKVQADMMVQMRRRTMKALGDMMKMSPKELRKKSTTDMFKTACASGGCHANLKRINRKVVQDYIASMTRKTGMSCKARMDQMFGGQMDTAPPQRKGRGGKSDEDKGMVKVQELMTKIRRMLDGEFREQKRALAQMVKGESELASLAKLSGQDRKRMMLIMRPKKTRSMYTKYVLSDGLLFELMAEKLKMSDKEIAAVVAASIKSDDYALSEDIMFDMNARIKAGKELYDRRCGVCHTMDKAGSAIKTREEWSTALKKMKHISYNLKAKECEVICDYLAKRDEKEEE